MDYSKTLNLPRTSFPMKANLPEKEKEILNRWRAINLDKKVFMQNRGKEKYILHDGPPYPTAKIHLGTAFNKTLKDILVKYKTMQGYYAPFVPGWDTHGLPIETQVLRELGKSFRNLEVMEIRQRCKEYALKYVDIQREQFRRLGVFGDWANPYLTLDPSYEVRVVEIFGKLALEGYIYKGLRPIHWCPHCETALAEAEIEYAEENSYSIYVKFPLLDYAGKKIPGLTDRLEEKSFLIWTTTPWTLPANVAIAVNPNYPYVAVGIKGNIYILAEPLLPVTAEKLGFGDYRVVAKFPGQALEGLKCSHPFFDRESVVILGDHVTLEQGTGCVHIAPGHGWEDYLVGEKYNLPVIMPINGQGVFTTEGGLFAGLFYQEADKKILEKLGAQKRLLHSETISHSYPHCWRCHNPVIFRATKQWFVNVDHRNLRARTLREIKEIKWSPTWGENRIASMVTQRPDWCISRQRAWGIPLPVFYCQSCEKSVITAETIQAVVKLFSREGSDAWFIHPANEILSADFTCPHCGGKEFQKEKDIMDVWLESGSSHDAVLRTRDELRWPADLYLEGSDQHRGWFQSSLLTATAVYDDSPYRAVLTTGWVLDATGKEMHKSRGNVVEPEKILDQYGADILRLWAVSADFRNDVRASEEIFQQLCEVYRKIRNTLRFCLANLNDFEPTGDRITYSSLTEIDCWALAQLQSLISKVTENYENWDLHLVYHAIHNFCVLQLSAFYLDVLKDRLYVLPEKSSSRRAAQTVVWEILVALTRIMAPILPFTVEEIWEFIPGREDYESIHLSSWPQVRPEWVDKDLVSRWERLLGVREEVYKVLEKARKDKIIGGSLEAAVNLYPQDSALRQVLESYKKDLPMIFIVSEVSLSPTEETDTIIGEAPNLKIGVRKARGEKCARCWNYTLSVGKNISHPQLCARCVEILTKSQI